MFTKVTSPNESFFISNIPLLMVGYGSLSEIKLIDSMVLMLETYKLDKETMRAKNDNPIEKISFSSSLFLVSFMIEVSPVDYKS